MREKWDLSQTGLAAKAGAADTTIQQVESGQIEPNPADTKNLAAALRIHEQRLRRSDIPIVPLWEMSIADQHKGQGGPRTVGLPGYVIIDPSGPWFRDNRGRWRVNRHVEEMAR